MNDPHAIWSAIREIYASDSLLAVFQVWNKWEDIQFRHDLNQYVVELEDCLADFNSIGLIVPDNIIGSAIIG